MKEEHKQCLLWIGIGVVWIAAIAVAAFIMSIIGG